MNNLGQTTELAQSHNTVELNAALLPKLFAWGIIFGVGVLALQGFQRPRGSGPDAIDELVRERDRIMRRVQQRKQMRAR